jgi:hypothetical protein
VGRHSTTVAKAMRLACASFLINWLWHDVHDGCQTPNISFIIASYAAAHLGLTLLDVNAASFTCRSAVVPLSWRELVCTSKGKRQRQSLHSGDSILHYFFDGTSAMVRTVPSRRRRKVNVVVVCGQCC